MPDPDSTPSPEALKLTAIVQKALKAATEAFDAVLIEHGVAALDDSYEISAQLSFKKREAPAESPDGDQA